MSIPRYTMSMSRGAEPSATGGWVQFADLHLLREWTGWAIEYRNGDFHFVDASTYADLRSDAWAKWSAEIEASGSEWWKADQLRDRRAGKYRAVKMSLMKY